MTNFDKELPAETDLKLYNLTAKPFNANSVVFYC